MRVLITFAIALLPTACFAQQAPDPDPMVLARTIDTTIEPLCQKLDKKDSFLCRANLTALEADVFYLETPRARNYLRKLFGNETDANVVAHGSTTYEQVMKDFLQLQSLYVK